MAHPFFTVIIVSYNAAEWLPRCVESVAAQTCEDFEAIIVDNGSADGSVASLPELDPRFRIIELDENAGFARANNIAAEQAAGDWLALLNPDAFAQADWLARQKEAIRQFPDFTMFGSRQNKALEADTLDGIGDFYHVSGLAWRAGFGHSRDRELADHHTAFAPCGAAAIYQRDAFMRVGGFDESFFCYHEDVDLAFRMRLAGGACLQNNLAEVDHVSSAISGRASDFAVYHGTRNRIWTFVKNMPGIWLWLLAPAHIAVNILVMTWSLFRSGRAKPTWLGVWHGIKGLGSVLRTRRKQKEFRSAKTGDVMRSLTWSPRSVYRRDLPRVQSLEMD